MAKSSRRTHSRVARSLQLTAACLVASGHTVNLHKDLLSTESPGKLGGTRKDNDWPCSGGLVAGHAESELEGGKGKD